MFWYMASLLNEGAQRNVPGCFMSAIERMIDEMRRRGYASKTIQEYSGSVRRLATYFDCCPSKLTLEQLREYQIHLAQRKDVSASYYNSTVTALRFLYLQTLGRDWSIDRLPYGRREHRLPVVLSRQEVFQLWRPLRQLKRRLLLMTAYSAALRNRRTRSSPRGRPGRESNADPRQARGGRTAWFPIRPLCND